MTVYREAGEAPCYKCDRATRELCTTCQRPTCERHLDARHMCGACDEAYYRYMRAEEPVMMTTALPFVVIAGLVVSLMSPVLLPVAIGIPIVGFPIAILVRRRRKEARFFRTMRERGALPEPKSLDPDEAAAARLVAQMERRLRRRPRKRT